jgi:hypothetical protein
VLPPFQERIFSQQKQLDAGLAQRKSSGILNVFAAKRRTIRDA